MFGDFAKLDSPRRLVQFWQNLQNITSTINPKLHEQHRMIICLLLAGKNYTPQGKTFEALYPAVLEDNSQSHILCLN